MTVEIDNRLYNDFVQWSDANGFPESYVTEYVNKAFRDRFMTDKYGDLNEKFEKKQTAKRTRKTKPKEVVAETPEQESEAIQVISEEVSVPEKTEPIAKPEKPKTTRKKVLKSK